MREPREHRVRDVKRAQWVKMHEDKFWEFNR